MSVRSLICIVALLMAVPAAAQQGASSSATNPKELGKVSWLRDYDQAIAQSKKTGKPLFLFFQEVPG